MSNVVRREKGNASVFPLPIGKNLTLKSLPMTVIECLLLQRQGVMPYKKGEMFSRKGHCCLSGVSAEIGSVTSFSPPILSWAGPPCQSSSASSKLIPAASTEQKGENINKSHLILACFLVLLRPLGSKNMGSTPSKDKRDAFLWFVFF